MVLFLNLIGKCVTFAKNLLRVNGYANILGLSHPAAIHLFWVGSDEFSFRLSLSLLLAIIGLGFISMFALFCG
jgi:hypothetical protein